MEDNGGEWLLLVSSWALYLVKPLRRTFSPRSWRNSSRAGPAVSLLYISSSVLWPARQYITPTFTWKLSWRAADTHTRQNTRRTVGINGMSSGLKFLLVPLVHPVSWVARSLLVCWGPVWDRTGPAQGGDTPTHLWWVTLGWCRV